MDRQGGKEIQKMNKEENNRENYTSSNFISITITFKVTKIKKNVFFNGRRGPIIQKEKINFTLHKKKKRF